MSFTVPKKGKADIHRVLDTQLAIVRMLLRNSELAPDRRDADVLVDGGGRDPTGRPLAFKALTKAAEALAWVQRLDYAWVREPEIRRALGDIHDRLKAGGEAARHRRRAVEVERKLAQLLEDEDDAALGQLAFWYVAVGKPLVLG